MYSNYTSSQKLQIMFCNWDFSHFQFENTRTCFPLCWFRLGCNDGHVGSGVTQGSKAQIHRRAAEWLAGLRQQGDETPTINPDHIGKTIAGGHPGFKARIYEGGAKLAVELRDQQVVVAKLTQKPNTKQ